MNKEGCSGKETVDIFLEDLKSQKLVFGSDIYEALREAMGIGLLYYERYKSNSGFLSESEEQDIQNQKDKVLKINGNNQIFIEMFEKIRKWMKADLGTIPAFRISWKLEDLKDKIREAKGRTDLV